MPILGTRVVRASEQLNSQIEDFNIARLRFKTKVRQALICDMLFADDGAVTANSVQQLQCLMDRFSQACKDFGLAISLKKTKALGQAVVTPPVISTEN